MIDIEYFQKRALAERAAALRANSLQGFRLHMDLVREYESRVHRTAA